MPINCSINHQDVEYRANIERMLHRIKDGVMRNISERHPNVRLHYGVEADMMTGGTRIDFELTEATHIRRCRSSIMLERGVTPEPRMLEEKFLQLYRSYRETYCHELETAERLQADIDRRLREAMNFYNGSHYSTAPEEPITVDYHISETERIIQQLREIDQRQQMRDMMRQNFSPFSRGRIDDPPPTLDVTPCSGEEMWKYHKRKDDKNAGTPKPKPSIWRRFAMQNLRERRYMQMARRMQSVVDKLEEESKRELPGDVELDMLEI